MYEVLIVCEHCGYEDEADSRSVPRMPCKKCNNRAWKKVDLSGCNEVAMAILTVLDLKHNRAFSQKEIFELVYKQTHIGKSGSERKTWYFTKTVVEREVEHMYELNLLKRAEIHGVIRYSIPDEDYLKHLDTIKRVNLKVMRTR